MSRLQKKKKIAYVKLANSYTIFHANNSLSVRTFFVLGKSVEIKYCLIVKLTNSSTISHKVIYTDIPNNDGNIQKGRKSTLIEKFLTSS